MAPLTASFPLRLMAAATLTLTGLLPATIGASKQNSTIRVNYYKEAM